LYPPAKVAFAQARFSPDADGGHRPLKLEGNLGAHSNITPAEQGNVADKKSLSGFHFVPFM
jgi:hypothetical protein